MESNNQYDKTKSNVKDSEETKDLKQDDNKSQATDGANSSREGTKEKDLGDLSEQVKGSDADADQSVGEKYN
ncbi:hypothetical protein DHW03_04960 [Pedobacter yonginense]|uniref:Uncharacterized protein n=1 Tax=Pedobacter yonginense TaxID=651869 RepID=A0A317EVD9_9SPHI|nr:hypothetical protein [Pedobacter yonginense]PWS29176.1 hypothetical protein DHW03_04960 [Pedobacter yonginense]